MPVSGNFYLNQAEMEENAAYIWEASGILEYGWTMEAVAAMLGNMQSESTINPGIWEGLKEGILTNGFGLVQWTPASNYINWCESRKPVALEPSNMNSALMRIDFEHTYNMQWIPTAKYPMSFDDFLKSTDTPETLAMAFLYDYERAGDLNQPIRATQARAWYNYLSGYVPPVPVKPRKLPLIYYSRKRRYF